MTCGSERASSGKLSRQKRLTSFDLFAGAGGLSLGLSWAGLETIYALEQDKWAAETYSRNNPTVPLDVRDIRTFTDNEIEQIAKLAPDVLVGGPPCQGFSHANTSNRDPKDPRNSLFQDFVRFTKIINPKLCLMENVPGFLRTKLSDGSMAIDAVRSAFAQIGYSIEWQVLYSADFGVPQSRDRLFIIATPIQLNSPPINWPSPSHHTPDSSAQTDFFQSQLLLFRHITLWDAISDLPQVYAGDNDRKYNTLPLNEYQSFMRYNAPEILCNHEPMRHTARITERFRAIGFGQSEADVPAHLRPRRRSGKGELSGIVYDQNSRRQHPNEPCNAMVASSHTNFIHPFLHRNFTVREMMRIQSFPDWYVVCGKRAVLSKKLSMRKGFLDDIYLDQRAQIGNAVPPLLAKAVGGTIIRFLEAFYQGELHAAA